MACIMRTPTHLLLLSLSVLAGLAACAPAKSAEVDAAAQHVSTQDPAALAAVVQARVAEALAPLATPGAEPSITVGQPRNDRLPACTEPVAFLPPGQRMRTSMSVGIRCAAPQAWTTYVPVTVSMSVNYLVATRSINAQEVITEADMQVQSADLNRVPPSAVQNPALVLGRIAERRINAGRPFRADTLRDPQSVVRGQQVRVTAIGNGFSITGEGEVLADASPGASVQVQTPSGQTVTGIVRNATLVEVLL